jgi:hypothetical protein
MSFCKVPNCGEMSLEGRLLCDAHAYPAEQKKTERRRIIEAQKKRKQSDEVMDILLGPDPCPKCGGKAYTWYVDEFYRCRPCGHKFGPHLERLTEEMREERKRKGKAKVIQSDEEEYS